MAASTARPRRLRCAPCVWPPSCAGCCGWDGRTLCSERGRKCCRGAHASSRALPPRPPAGPERGAAEAQETDRQTDGRRESGEEGGAGRCCRCERLLRGCGADAVSARGRRRHVLRRNWGSVTAWRGGNQCRLFFRAVKGVFVECDCLGNQSRALTFVGQKPHLLNAFNCGR